MTGGSQQLRRFRIAVRAGTTWEEAAGIAGIALGEAKLIYAEDAKNPPPEEAYVLLGEPVSEPEQLAEPEPEEPAPIARRATTYATANTDDPENRHPEDYYPTHPAATRALLAVEEFEGAIWEPACGEGDMSRVLEAAGHEVISTDLIDRGYGQGGRDFMMEWFPLAPNVVTNPPFKYAQEFIERALSLTRGKGKVCMFLRLAFLEGLQRGKWLPTTPLARVWVMSRRVPMQRGRLSEEGDGHGVIAFAWFVFEHGHEGAPTIGWLDWKDH